MVSWSEHDLVDATARRLVARAELHDPEVTALVSSVAERSDGRLVGLDHRVKTVESLTRKLTDLTGLDPTLDAETAGSKVYDVLRYTVVSDDYRYMQVHDRVLDGPRQRGVTVVMTVNRWAEPGYRGINVRLGLGDWRFEVQFHTPASYEATKASRGYYEERRLASTSEERRNDLARFTEAVFSRAPVPPGAL